MDELDSLNLFVIIYISLADVAELADALDLGSSVPDVQVQVLLPAVIKWLKSRLFGVRVA